MGHNVTVKDTMFSHQERPWHFMETQDRTMVTDRPPADVSELLSPAFSGTGWNVVQNPVFTITPELMARLEAGEVIDSIPMDSVIQFDGEDDRPEFWANLRDSDANPLGIVGSRMEPLQNEKAAEFVWALVDTDQARFETGGSLKGGQVVWYMVQLLDPPKMPEGEEMDAYVSIVNYHNGKGSLRCMNHQIRIVCNNTLDAATYGAKSQWEIRHTASIRDKLAEAQRALGFAHVANEKFAAVANALVMRPFTVNDFADVLGTLYPIPVDGTALAQKRAHERHDDVLGCWKSSPNLENIRKTAWGGWNAITEFVDHGQKYRSDEARMLSLMQPQGRSAEFKRHALEVVAAKVEVDLLTV